MSTSRIFRLVDAEVRHGRDSLEYARVFCEVPANERVWREAQVRQARLYVRAQVASIREWRALGDDATNAAASALEFLNGVLRPQFKRELRRLIEIMPRARRPMLQAAE